MKRTHGARDLEAIRKLRLPGNPEGTTSKRRYFLLSGHGPISRGNFQMNSAPFKTKSLDHSRLHNNQNSTGVNRNPVIAKRYM